MDENELRYDWLKIERWSVETNFFELMVNTLVPPFRFNTVEQQIYRGGYPTLRNFRFLRRLQLRTIVSVIPEPPTSDLIAFCSTEKIQHYYFKASKFTSDVTVSPEVLSEILHVILASKNLPLYVHCLDGGNVTGLVIMMLRKLQNWNLSKFAFEFCQLSTDQTIEKEESEYVATFAEEILIPQPSPEWLWQNLSIQKHPTLKIKFDKGERDVQDCIRYV